MKILSYLAMTGLLFAGAACTTIAPKKPIAQPTPPPRHSYWIGDGVTGAPSIRIVLSQQRAYFYKGGKLVGVSTISSGKKGFETPPGEYKVIQKDKDHASNLYGDYIDEDGNIVQANVDVTKDKMPDNAAAFVGAKMPFYLRFTGGYGMHAGYLPGYRASHGCVRMPSSMADHFFNAAELGTPVVVEP
ncbi:MAG TPA: L,D-transpeptidase family protein [Chthoniobacteraceae bacterium]|jgi:lipoprotein-anchoring transpeptidase ErfK/SrfK|nr:L,D-transpeptidase family protein [Chthoniobacteraceae bacterium]